MKLIIAALIALSSFSVFAQSQRLQAGQNATIQCPAGTSMKVINIDNRTVNLSCATTCRIAAMEECTWSTTYGGYQGCSGGGDYYIVAYLPNGKVQKISTDSVDLKTAQANFPNFADFVVERGLCDSATY